ncbi:hypothetical protein [Vallitalea okinawensis]|uniref:hypothetical protein n=1 Tax=Vallitalea okinawensis TaxID=2078660 RepID=UPI000CFDBC0E|nr:hypothetical protein [Vallitalea okinawensis]
MTYCPKCKQIYETNEKVCIKCKNELEEASTVCLTNVSSIYEADQIVQLLKTLDVIGFHKSEEAGDYLQIRQGFTFDRFNIFVSSYDLEKAQKILEDYQNATKINNSEKDIDNTDENDYPIDTYITRRRRVARSIIVVTFIMLFMFIATYFMSLIK